MNARLIFVCFVLAILCSCSNAPKEKRIKIGFAMDTLKEERWQRDHDAFEAVAKR